MPTPPRLTIFHRRNTSTSSTTPPASPSKPPPDLRLRISTNSPTTAAKARHLFPPLKSPALWKPANYPRDTLKHQSNTFTTLSATRRRLRLHPTVPRHAASIRTSQCAPDTVWNDTFTDLDMDDTHHGFIDFAGYDLGCAYSCSEEESGGGGNGV
ncbi:hypothetical protein P154DRAFT_561484 [Amniculicola lignicola CBS 123094]|uniref:Uncharacterized protein n=1 Tax=Amniculicola lignicola CBS 123094 TaxID=1392246 RepID=A0A6A5WN71_9PLEO|nr:hypothetical protein P154DRAFT_561484 [Amniculicola lignicola CBS 123094]